MAFRSGAYATVWEVTPKGENCIVNLSTRRKAQDSGEWVTDFKSKFTFFVRDAGKRAQSLHRGDFIRIKDCAVTNKYDAEKKVEYWNCYVYDFDLVNSNDNKSNAAPANHIADDDESWLS